MRWKLGFIVLAGYALCACATVSNSNDLETRENREPAAAKPQVTAPEASGSSSEINKIIEESKPVISDLSGENDKAPLQIPIEINRRVSGWIKYFTERDRDRTQRYLERGEAMRSHIEAILKENEVPTELFYLAMIESGFVQHAKSRAKAVGIWQFVKGTGKNYGMIVNNQVDERRNWIKSTEAAASYLKDLHNVFGSWYLALAAYNAGEHKIVRSIMKGKTRDFWALAEAGLLPQETMNYVPKFLAAHIVGRNYKRFGFQLTIDPEENWEPWEAVSVPAGVKLAELAKTTDVPFELLKRWNNDLIKGYTPPSKTGSVDIYVPKSVMAKFETAQEQIAKLKRYHTAGERRQYASNAQDVDHSYEFYVVQRGDNLSTISKRLGLSTRKLMRINGLRRNRIHPGQRLKYYAPSSAEGSGKKRKPASSRARGADQADAEQTGAE